MRKLSPTFIECLKSGFLSALTQKVIVDRDLDLQIRDIVDKQSAQDFLSQIPQLKENIVQNGKASS